MADLKLSRLTFAGGLFATFVAGIAAGLSTGLTLGAAVAREPLPRFTPLLATSKTVMDEPIVYPTGTAKLTTGIVALQPGQETGWHTHGMPLTGIVLDGELTVDYGPKGRRTFTQGQSIAEAITVPHNGRNTGDGIMRLFAVFIGAEGLPASTPAAAPAPETPPAVKPATPPQ